MKSFRINIFTEFPNPLLLYFVFEGGQELKECFSIWITRTFFMPTYFDTFCCVCLWDHRTPKKDPALHAMLISVPCSSFSFATEEILILWPLCNILGIFSNISLAFQWHFSRISMTILPFSNLLVTF